MYCKCHLNSANLIVAILFVSSLADGQSPVVFTLVFVNRSASKQARLGTVRPIGHLTFQDRLIDTATKLVLDLIARHCPLIEFRCDSLSQLQRLSFFNVTANSLCSAFIAPNHFV